MAPALALTGLGQALDLGPHELVSLVGGGGKTTALFALGRQLNGTVVLTTTTKMERSRTDGFPVVFDPSDDELADALTAHRCVLAWQDVANGKARGVGPADCDRWFGAVDHVVVEADGARRRPLTAPGPFEPVVPSLTSILVLCVGAAALGRVIADQCHRPMRVASVAGCSPYQRLTPERLATVLLSERGLSKGRPPQARVAVLVSNVDSSDERFVAELAHIVGDRATVIAIARHAAHENGRPDPR